MPQTFSRAVRFVVLGWGVALYAQDASLVLRTSVTYNTQRATLTLNDEQRKKAEELGRDAQAANQARKFGDAMRDYYLAVNAPASIDFTTKRPPAQTHSLYSLADAKGFGEHGVTARV